MDAIKNLLLWRTAAEPVLLVLEDLHWFDAESLAVLDEVVDSMGAVRLVLLVSYRPEYRHMWAGKSYYSHIRVDPLRDTSAEEFLRSLVGDDANLAQLKRLLIQRAAATPLFLEEIVRDLAESGALVGNSGQYRLSRDVDQIAVPPTIQAVLAARIDRLPSEQRRLLQVASIIGRDVPIALLKIVGELSEDALREGMAALQTSEFLYQTRLIPEAEYSFKHALTHDVAVRTLLLDKRRTLHARTARAIEQLYPDRLVALSESLAEHFEKGEVWASAALYWLRAAEKAKDRYSYERGIQFCRKAIFCTKRTPGLPEQERQVLLMLGDLQSLTGNFDAANQSYQRAMELNSDDGQRRSVFCRLHRSGFVTRNEARIAYIEHGAGDQAIFLVIPMCYEATIFQPLVEELCHEFRIIQIFPRGNGPSDPAPWPYRFGERVKDTQAVIAALAAKENIAVGISDGATLLVRLACAYPDSIQKLILVGAGVGNLGVGTPFETASGWSEKYLEKLEREGIEAVATEIVREILPERGMEDVAEAYRRELAMLPRETWLNFMDPGPDVEVGQILRNVRVSTLVMHGTDDRSVPLAQGRYVADQIAGAALYLFEGIGHVPVFTATTEFCRVVRHFLQSGGVPAQFSPATAYSVARQ
jgi:pimeloyl-ACP methyl ester carboxylesterase